MAVLFGTPVTRYVRVRVERGQTDRQVDMKARQGVSLQAYHQNERAKRHGKNRSNSCSTKREYERVSRQGCDFATCIVTIS